MSIPTPSLINVASTSRRWREGRDSAVAETRRDAFDAIDAIEHNDAQATRASSSASRPNDAPTSTSSCAARRLSSLHRVVVDAIDAHKHTKKTQAPRPHAADAEPRLARRSCWQVELSMVWVLVVLSCDVVPKTKKYFNISSIDP